MSNNLNTFYNGFHTLPHSQQKIISKNGVPKFAIIALATIFVIGMFTVGFDQGHMFSIIQGAEAFDELYLHELTHDVRHAAGFPCH